MKGWLRKLAFSKVKKFPTVNVKPSNLALKKRACNPANNVESVKDMKLWPNDIELIVCAVILSSLGSTCGGIRRISTSTGILGIGMLIRDGVERLGLNHAG